MLFRFSALLLIASLCAAQTPTASPTRSDTIIVPPSTLVALRLISSIKSRSTKPGDPVRAVVAFPVAIGSRVAIPAGTFVEGVVNKVNAHPRSSDTATVQLRFTRLLFSNGYSAPLVATNTQAMLLAPDTAGHPVILLADARDGAPYLGVPGQTNPQPPPLPSVGPSPGTLAGIGIGAVVGILVLSLTLGHHHAAHTDYVLFDSGWQFQMALQEPLTLDATQVAAAAALPH